MMSPQCKEYHIKGLEIKKELEHLHTKLDTFNVSSETFLKLKIQGKSFEIPQKVSNSPDTKDKKNPMIWCSETVLPGSPRFVYESLMDPRHRTQWDQQLSAFRRIVVDDAFPDIYIMHNSTKPAVGGLISPRDFVDLVTVHEFENKVTGYQSLHFTMHSIEREDIPKQKGHIRANLVMCGTLFERLSDEEIEEMKLPKLMVSVDGNGDEKKKKQQCEWTKMRYIIQTDIKGWIPQSVINLAMSQSNNEIMNNLRNYIIQKRLGFEAEDK